MTSTVPIPSPDNLRATGFMVLGMGLFATEDFLVKGVTGAMPVAQVLFVLSMGGALIFTLLCRRTGLPLVTRDLIAPAILARNGAEAVATVAYVSALAMVPLSLVSAILQATPLLVTAGAAIWLGEQVGWRRWAAVIVGLIGVLVILRPGLEGFRPPALLVVLATICLATRDVISRRIPERIATAQLSLWAYGTLAVGTGLLWALTPEVAVPPLPVWRDLALAVIIGAAAYMALTAATRLGDVSAVIPFRYTRLLFALFLATVFLGETPDTATLVGAGIVVASGLYALWRERRVRAR